MGKRLFAAVGRCPGGVVHLDETLEDAARRELREETGLEQVYLEQLYTFGAARATCASAW